MVPMMQMTEGLVPEPEMEFENWRELAACVRLDEGEVDFFPDPEDVGAIAVAKAVCATCPVAEECLAYAIETNQSEGIWGGLTAKERARLRRRWLERMRRAS